MPDSNLQALVTRRRSSTVEHSFRKAEVVSSILTVGLDTNIAGFETLEDSQILPSGRNPSKKGVALLPQAQVDQP